MTSTYTANKRIEKPASGDYPNTWATPVNVDWDVIDQAFGGTTSLNATGGSATLTAAQYRSLFIGISGAMSASVTYTIPSGVGGQWIVYNSTTDATGGPWSVTIASGGGGSSIVLSRMQRIVVVSDGTNIRKLGYLIEDANGDVSITNDLTVGGDITATSSISAGTTSSDGIGNVREVPANSQTSSYTLQASDSGKYVSITTGGVTVPSGVFSTGQTISIYNNSSSNQTITQGSGVTLTQAGTTNTGNRSLGSYGFSTILCTGTNSFIIMGAGLS